MQPKAFGIRMTVLGAVLLATPLLASSAQAELSQATTHARTHTTSASHKPTPVPTLHVVHAVAHTTVSLHGKPPAKAQASASAHSAYRGGMQCVTFARASTGIQLKGNAANWWDNASGVYARGQTPEPGSVLNFRANGGMRLGHVAVVSHVVSDREIEIDHANWAGPGASRGGVSRGIPVVDVSPNNDWSAVRVGLGHSGNYGSIYPTYGFIYDRPDSGLSASLTPARFDEVAEAPMRTLR